MTTQSDRVRVRFAPSPTGYLHIGGLRTALFNFLFAQRHKGVFVLRIEDTDRSRFVPDALEDIQRGLAWAGIRYDEGPGIGGPSEPYFQSDRKSLYDAHIDALLASGKAYYAFDTESEINTLKEQRSRAEGTKRAYDAESRLRMRNSLTLGKEKTRALLSAGEPYVVRLKVEPGERIVFHDVIRGEVSISSSELDDQVLRKSDGMPTYHLANVVDDHRMAITHVIRGEEWLPSTPKHILIYRALGWEPPKMAHLPLILSPKGGKLSKRNAEHLGIPVSVRQYIEEGYEPEALINYLALLGWNPGDERERFKLEELITSFSLERVGSAGVQFSLDKLLWFNAGIVRERSAEENGVRLMQIVADAGLSIGKERAVALADLYAERVSRMNEIPEAASYLLNDPVMDREIVAKRWTPEASDRLEVLGERFRDDALEWEKAAILQGIKSVAKELDVKMGAVMMPLRIAVTGGLTGPDVADMLVFLGREEALSRIHKASVENRKAVESA